MQSALDQKLRSKRSSANKRMTFITTADKMHDAVYLVGLDATNEMGDLCIYKYRQHF